jgi:hypothetical protein
VNVLYRDGRKGNHAKVADVTKPELHYDGFPSPNTTPVPDDVFDVLAPLLTEAELRVLLYVIRRTFGFKKDADAISQSQMATGIVTRDGRRLDSGTGMSKSAVWRGCDGLVKKGILLREPRKSEQGDSDINVYSLHFKSGVTLEKSDGHSAKESPVTLQKSTQETVNKKQSYKGNDRHQLSDEERMEQIRLSAERVGGIT